MIWNLVFFLPLWLSVHRVGPQPCNHSASCQPRPNHSHGPVTERFARLNRLHFTVPFASISFRALGPYEHVRCTLLSHPPYTLPCPRVCLPAFFIQAVPVRSVCCKCTVYIHYLCTGRVQCCPAQLTFTTQWLPIPWRHLDDRIPLLHYNKAQYCWTLQGTSALTRARVAVSATFAMVGGGGQNDPPPV